MTAEKRFAWVPIDKDPRLPIILETLSALFDPSGGSRDGAASPGTNIEGSLSEAPIQHISLSTVAQSLLNSLDRWLILEGITAIRKGLPRPRIYGFKFCDCTNVLNELLLGTVEATEPERES